MNQRIFKLAVQAGLRFTQQMSNPMVPVVDGRETDLEKFAELIVKECAAIADDGFGSAHFGLGISGKMLKEHFGVDK